MTEISLSKIQRTEQELLDDLKRDAETYSAYLSLDDSFRKEFRNFCLGKQGLKITYDPFFKKVFDAEAHPDRLSRLLSAILNEKVTVKRMLPNESGRITAQGSLLIMDILVELEDGSLANVEIQKIGYLFPGERSACYSADLLLRQYSRVRSEKGKHFSYKDLKKVYTIVLFEKSPKEIKSFSEAYIHYSETIFNTGLKLNLLQEYVIVSLDNFREIIQNKGTELEAWLTFLSSEEPEDIQKLVEQYPYFLELYQEIEEFRRHPKELVYMYSEALRIMDENTVQYMIEEQQKEIEAQRKENEEQQKKIDGKQKEIEGQQKEIEGQQKKIEGKQKEIEVQQKEIKAQQKENEVQQKLLKEKDYELKRLQALLQEKGIV